MEGKKIGIAGESGVGKSTLINLLMRLWQPERGSIEIDYMDIREYDIDLLRKHIGVVQEVLKKVGLWGYIRRNML